MAELNAVRLDSSYNI